MSSLSQGNDIDGACSRASFVHICLFPRKVETIVFHCLMPTAGVVLHGIEKHAVHVEHGGFQMELGVVVFFQIFL